MHVLLCLFFFYLKMWEGATSIIILLGVIIEILTRYRIFCLNHNYYFKMRVRHYNPYKVQVDKTLF